MDNKIYEYIKNGITIKGNPLDGYEVFTIPTQHFKMDSLHQLTPETFENAIQKQKEREELTSEIFKEVQKEINQEIINQLMGHEPNPDIIPMITIDRLYKRYHTETIFGLDNKWLNELDGMDLGNGEKKKVYKQYAKDEFINKLLFDDNFYQKWGEDCCEELTYEERYKIWFGNNFETGMEYNPEIVPDWDNDYYEPTPKRKLK